jgi:hypothetical protein
MRVVIMFECRSEARSYQEASTRFASRLGSANKSLNLAQMQVFFAKRSHLISRKGLEMQKIMACGQAVMIHVWGL